MAINPILSTAVSGLQANATRASVSANNIANQNTRDFTASKVNSNTIISNSSPAGGSGVQAQVIATNEPVNLVHEVTQLIEAEVAYRANAEVIRTAEELTEETLDIIA